jgi:hypothetical protein
LLVLLDLFVHVFPPVQVPLVLLHPI